MFQGLFLCPGFTIGALAGEGIEHGETTAFRREPGKRKPPEHAPDGLEGLGETSTVAAMGKGDDWGTYDEGGRPLRTPAPVLRCA